MPVGSIAPELIVLGGSVGVLLWALFAPRRLQASGAAVLSLAVIAAAGIAAWPMLRGGQGTTFFGTYAVDDTAVWAKLLILGVTAVTVLLSYEWFRTEPRHGEYYSLLLMSALGAILLAGAADLMEVLLGVLLASATGYVLAGYHRAHAPSGEAAIKYFLLGAFANAAMVFGVALLFGLGGSTLLGVLRDELVGTSSVGLVGGAVLVLVGLLFKMGAVPAHAWMPDVAEGSPAPVAAFVTVAPKIGALIAVGRLMLALPEDGLGWRPLVAVVAALTMTLGNLTALWQDDVRRLLGWSAVSQSGYGLMAVVALGRSDLAVPSLLFFLAAYALANLAAFGVVIELRGRTDRLRYAGLGRTHPALALSLVVAFLSFVGIPPLAGFTAKLALFGATIEAGYTWLAVLAILNTVVSLAYYARVLAPAYFEPVAEPLPVLGRWARTATLATAAGVVVLGILAQPFLDGFSLAGLFPG
ncbi:MAG TPA: NADH-quinone oxidoreductase subunit N [Actinomycetota bacterium]